MYSLRQRLLALAFGLACHTAFAGAVGAMAWKLYHGMGGGPRLPLPGALAWDLLLILQFPLLHSLLLTRRGGRLLERLIPGGIGRELRTTTFALIASLQLLLVFSAWAPLGPVWFGIRGLWKGIDTALWTVYCMTAPLHKEARYSRRHGEVFREYQRRVPYFFPRLFPFPPHQEPS